MQKAKEKPNVAEIDDIIGRNFEIKKRLGRGAYGIVWRAIDRSTSKLVAVKKIFDAFRNETDAQRTFREIMFLRAFRTHPNIIQLYSVHRAANDMDIYLSFEYMESDLHNVIKRGNVLKDLHKRYIMYQLLNAVLFIHSGNVIHRDLKPSNILLDSSCRCKIADFGLARSIANPKVGQSPSKLNSCSSSTVNSSLNSREEEERLLQQGGSELTLTDYVATRWYRAPEILIASKRYTKGIDMWSLGCILGEMIRGRPLFPGSCTINQIERIVKALPTSKEQELRAINSEGGRGDERHFGSNFLVLFNDMLKANRNGLGAPEKGKDSLLTLDQLLGDGPEDAVELTKQLLVLDPLRRLTAKEAIQHCYLERFRKVNTETELNKDVVTPFRDDVQLKVNEYRAKIYEIMSMNTSGSQGTAAATKALQSTGKVERTTAQKSHAATVRAKFMSAGSTTIANGTHGNVCNEAVEKRDQRISQLMDNCSCPFARLAKSSAASSSGYKLEVNENGATVNKNKLQPPPRNDQFGTRMRNKVACMPVVTEAPTNYKPTMKTGAQQLSTSNGGVVLPRNEDRHVVAATVLTRMGGGGGGGAGGQHYHKTEQEKGVGRGKAVTAIGHSESLPQRCYENRLKVLEEKIRRHKQEMTDFLRVGNNNKKLASIQAAAAAKQPVQSVFVQNGRLGEALTGNGRRIESKLSCSSSSSTSNQSLPTKGVEGQKPAFRCGCKPSGGGTMTSTAASKGLAARKALGTNGKLFSKSTSSTSLTGFGVISASDLYKLRSTEIIGHN